MPETRVELEIQAGSDGRMSGSCRLRDFGGDIITVKQLTLNGRRLSAVTPDGRLFFEGELKQNATEIEGLLDPEERSLPVKLQQNNPAFRKFTVPRISALGAPVLEYGYQQPASGDGWESATLADAGLDEGRISAFLSRVLAGEYGRAEGVLIARKGKLVLEEYFYGCSRDRPHTIQSISKSVTSLLVGIALEQGLLKSLDYPVHMFFPEYSGRKWIDRKYDISIRNLLTMSAALDWNERLPYSNPKNSNSAMNASPDWIGYVLDRDLAGRPGEVSSYTSGLAILLGGILKKASGKRADAYAEMTLFKQLGIRKYFWGAHMDGTQHTGGGLWLRPRDLAKIGQVVLNEGKWNGRHVVSEAWIAESTQPQLPVEKGRPRFSQGYGYQWWRDTFTMNGRPVEVVAGHGYGGQYLGIIPSLEMVLAFTAGDYVVESGPKFDYYKVIEEEILPAVVPGGKAR